MPIFEYKCNKCGKKFERLVQGREKVNCPKCKSRDLDKLFSVFGTKSGESYSSGSSSCAGCTSSSCSTCSH